MYAFRTHVHIDKIGEADAHRRCCVVHRTAASPLARFGNSSRSCQHASGLWVAEARHLSSDVVSAAVGVSGGARFAAHIITTVLQYDRPTMYGVCNATVGIMQTVFPNGQVGEQHEFRSIE